MVVKIEGFLQDLYDLYIIGDVIMYEVQNQKVFLILSL